MKNLEMIKGNLELQKYALETMISEQEVLIENTHATIYAEGISDTLIKDLKESLPKKEEELKTLKGVLSQISNALLFFET